jgi:hypothetical protein
MSPRRDRAIPATISPHIECQKEGGGGEFARAWSPSMSKPEEDEERQAWSPFWSHVAEGPTERRGGGGESEWGREKAEREHGEKRRCCVPRFRGSILNPWNGNGNGPPTRNGGGPQKQCEWDATDWWTNGLWDTLSPDAYPSIPRTPVTKISSRNKQKRPQLTQCIPVQQ